MRFIEDLRDKYAGQEIWIIGTGGSGDDFPLDFFDDKISIAMRPNEAIFPNCTYNFCGWELYWAFFAKFTACPLPKQIFTLNPRHKPKPKALGKYLEIPIFMRTLKWYSFGHRKEPPLERYMRESIKHIINKDSHHYCGDGLTQGWAVEAALVLGAKMITLVGCDNSGTKHKAYAERLKFFYANPRAKAGKGHWDFSPSKDGFSQKQLALLERKYAAYRSGLMKLVNVLRSYDIEIRKYFYRRGYETI